MALSGGLGLQGQVESLASVSWETQASLLFSVAVAILFGFICILALISWWAWLVGVTCGCSGVMANLHITLSLGRMASYGVKQNDRLDTLLLHLGTSY